MTDQDYALMLVEEIAVNNYIGAMRHETAERCVFCEISIIAHGVVGCQQNPDCPVRLSGEARIREFKEANLRRKAGK